jgi:hypothetical protein
LLLSDRTLGHGSLTGCMFLMDLERDLIIVQVRRKQGAGYGDWVAKLLETVVQCLR